MTLHPAFPCNQCGACCRHVDRADETLFLDRGDGICRHYGMESRRCNIYDARPAICQVEKQFLMNYQQHYSWQTFIEINQIACQFLEELDNR